MKHIWRKDGDAPFAKSRKSEWETVEAHAAKQRGHHSGARGFAYRIRLASGRFCANLGGTAKSTFRPNQGREGVFIYIHITNSMKGWHDVPEGKLQFGLFKP